MFDDEDDIIVAQKRKTDDSLLLYTDKDDIDYSENSPNNDGKNKKCKYPLIIYVFFFTFIIFIAALLTFLFLLALMDENYDIIDDEDIYDKPKITYHNYSKIICKNGLEVLFVQINENDTAGGIIGYLI